MQIGDVEGVKTLCLIDDIVDAAGTITNDSQHHVGKPFFNLYTRYRDHCVMSDPASFRVQESASTEMVLLTHPLC